MEESLLPQYPFQLDIIFLILLIEQIKNRM